MNSFPLSKITGKKIVVEQNIPSRGFLIYTKSLLDLDFDNTFDLHAGFKAW